MSSTGHAESSLHPDHLCQLSEILRHANRRYSDIATRVRNSLRLTHRARKHAVALRLRVSIRCALALDPKQISHVPFPVLEVTPPPFELSKVVVGREREMVRLSRGPAIRIPAQRPQPFTYPVSNRDSRQHEGRHDMDSDSDELYSSDYDDGMDFPFSIEHSPCIPSSLDSVPIRPARPLLHLDLPEDITRYSWGSDSNDQSIMSSGSGSSMCSVPQTPQDEMPKLMISVKRKSYGADVDMEADCMEKRPRYERKEWLIPAARRVPRTNCSRR